MGVLRKRHWVIILLVFFLLSTSFRPLWAYYYHQKIRFSELRNHSRVPREDAINFSNRIQQIENQLKQIDKSMTKKSEQYAHDRTEIQTDSDELHTLIKKQYRQYQEKVNQVADKLTTTVDQLTEDKALINGVRAFVKVIKSTHA